MMYNALMAYMFVTLYRSDIKDVAILREADADDNLIIFNKMGFNNINEYLNSYPGKFAIDTDVFVKYMTNNGDETDYLWCDKCGKISINMSSECVNLDFINKYYKSMDSFPTPFIIPTIRDVAKCENLANVDYKKLWFCSDWNEEYAFS